MKVKEWLKTNVNKTAYTIRANRKDYLCNIFEANSYFGEMEIKKVTYKHGTELLPILHIA